MYNKKHCDLKSELLDFSHIHIIIKFYINTHHIQQTLVKL